jgi:hypothetical protein
MKLLIKVPQGGLLPKYYGVAWADWRSRDAYCLPIGLNLIGAMVRAAYLWLRTAVYEVPLDPRAAFEAGLRASEGYQQGYSLGFEAGRQHGEHRGYDQGVHDAHIAQQMNAAYGRATTPAPLTDDMVAGVDSQLPKH